MADQREWDRTVASLEAIATARLGPLQAEVAHIMAAVRNALEAADLQLEDMLDADIIAFVKTRVKEGS
jgi:hypothetical protein